MLINVLHRERVVIAHDGSRGLNITGCTVILRDEDSVHAAIEELQGAHLFGEKVVLSQLKQIHIAKGVPDLGWGWTASQDPNPCKAQVRGPLTAPPADMFASVREQRRLVFSHLPQLEVQVKARRPASRTHTALYTLLHKYNVVCMSEVINTQKLMSDGQKADNIHVQVDLASRQEAINAEFEFNKSSLAGHKLAVHCWQLPMQHLGASWSTGRGSGHFSGVRDQGSAVGTNFEEVSIENQPMMLASNRFVEQNQI